MFAMQLRYLSRKRGHQTLIMQKSGVSRSLRILRRTDRDLANRLGRDRGNQSTTQRSYTEGRRAFPDVDDAVILKNFGDVPEDFDCART
jgi:hypothetical protein